MVAPNVKLTINIKQLSRTHTDSKTILTAIFQANLGKLVAPVNLNSQSSLSWASSGDRM